jgi:PBSX family phage terminase large subunit
MVATMPASTVTFAPYGSHRTLFSSRSPELLGAGPAGTGKTFTIVWRLHIMAMRYPGARILMTRKDLESLKPAALTTFVNGVLPHLVGVETFGGNKFTPAEFRYTNGSVIQVTGLDRPEKVKSAEYDVIYVNEATEIPESTWEMLTSRLRNGVMPYQMIIGDCNPAGPKHWLRQRCIAGKTQMIESSHKDNPEYWDRDAQDWTPKGRTYVNRTLAGLSGAEYDRLYLGKWAAAHGLVYPQFTPEMIREIDVTGWRTVMGVDVGSRNPTAILTAHVRGDGAHVHVSREVYRADMTSDDITQAIKDAADLCDPDAIYIDPSGKGYIGSLHQHGYPAESAENDVIVGIQRVRSILRSGFSIDPACTETIGEFGEYAYKPNPKIETDKPIKENDHAMDALRYMAMSLDEPPVDLAAYYGRAAS